jgi:predicted GNAT family acetyltransferase
MKITNVSYREVENELGLLKPDLLDKSANYIGCFIDKKLVGIVSYVEHESVIYLCHAYVKEEYRANGIYKLLWDYRDNELKDSTKTIYAHCNTSSLKRFINNGYEIEKTLFKVVKKK